MATERACRHREAKPVYLSALGGEVCSCKRCGEVLWWQIGEEPRVYPRTVIRNGPKQPFKVVPPVVKGGMEYD